MKKELLAEVEGCYVRSCCSIPKYGIVTLQIYRIDSQEIRFENHCPPERLPERFARRQVRETRSVPAIWHRPGSSY